MIIVIAVNENVECCGVSVMWKRKRKRAISILFVSFFASLALALSIIWCKIIIFYLMLLLYNITTLTLYAITQI
jgi:hypothetical protein